MMEDEIKLDTYAYAGRRIYQRADSLYFPPCLVIFLYKKKKVTLALFLIFLFFCSLPINHTKSLQRVAVEI